LLVANPNLNLFPPGRLKTFSFPQEVPTKVPQSETFEEEMEMKTINLIEELPARAGLKVVRLNDPNNGLTEDEIQDRNEFIHWYLQTDFSLIRMIPVQAEKDFFSFDITDPTSAFNTHDFQRTIEPFDRYGYAMKKIMERVKDLAILHSVVGSDEDRLQIQKRYESLVEIEFRAQLVNLLVRFRLTASQYRTQKIKQRIGEINRRILECKRIWEQYAPWDI